MKVRLTCEGLVEVGEGGDWPGGWVGVGTFMDALWLRMQLWLWLWSCAEYRSLHSLPCPALPCPALP